MVHYDGNSQYTKKKSNQLISQLTLPPGLIFITLYPINPRTVTPSNRYPVQPSNPRTILHDKYFLARFLYFAIFDY